MRDSSPTSSPYGLVREMAEILRPAISLADLLESAPAVGVPAKEEMFRSFCRMCHGGCGTLVYKQGEKVTKVEGDPEHPLNLGSLCAKGQASIQQLYSPFRLKYPLMRAGARGEGRWKRVSWEEALDYAAARLLEIKERYGAEAVAMGQGTGRLFFMFPVRLCNAFGTPNWFEPGWQQCLFPRVAASFLTFGKYTMPDYYAFGGVYPKCLVLWGVNPAASNDNGNIVTRLAKARAEGQGKLIVVDPRLTPVAAQADIWVPLRPGTDDALALGWINIILNQRLYDDDFLRQRTDAPFLIRDDNDLPLAESHLEAGGDPARHIVWDEVRGGPGRAEAPDARPALFGSFTVGGIRCSTALERLRQRVAPFSPEEVSRITWLPAEKIIEGAVTYAISRPASIQCGVALDHTNNTVQTARAVWLLPALCGNVDVPGGNIFAAQLPPIQTCYSIKLALSEKLPPEQLDKQLGSDKYLLGSGRHSLFPSAQIPALMKAIISERPYPIKGLMVFGGNHLLGCADASNLVYEAIKRLEFIMVADLFMTPAAELADLVLPAAGWLERSTIAGWPSFCDSVLGFQQKMAQMFERKEDELICMELGRKLGLAEEFPWKDMEEYLNWLCQDSGFSWTELKDKGFIMGKKTYRQYHDLHTPSGKIELYPFALKNLGYEPLPFYREPGESPLSDPDLAREYPLVLTTGGRVPVYMHTEHRHLPWLRKLRPDPVVEINPDTARPLGIRDGDWVIIETRRGKCRQRARLTQGIHPRVIHGEHGWWFPEKPGAEPSLHGCWESNINVLTDGEDCDPMIGSTYLKGLLCKIYKET